MNYRIQKALFVKTIGQLGMNLTQVSGRINPLCVINIEVCGMNYRIQKTVCGMNSQDSGGDK